MEEVEVGLRLTGRLGTYESAFAVGEANILILNLHIFPKRQVLFEIVSMELRDAKVGV